MNKSKECLDLTCAKKHNKIGKYRYHCRIQNDNRINYWTEEQLTILKENYAIKGGRFVSDLTNRTIMSVCSKAKTLGIKIIKQPRTNIKKEKALIMAKVIEHFVNNPDTPLKETGAKFNVGYSAAVNFLDKWFYKKINLPITISIMSNI